MEPSLKLCSESLSLLSTQKNLLAFSAGVDSSALFFLLQHYGIQFDIALVNYGLREQADEEEIYVKRLALEHKIEAYTIKAPSFEQNFEKSARDFRYAFFDDLMLKGQYDNLLTAHQLNDQLEWFLMRFTKGAGVSELLGLKKFSRRKNYQLIRPLLDYSKEELLAYLDFHDYKYFLDESNLDEQYERNLFRKNFSNKLICNYREGIKRSFEYLLEDKEVLSTGYIELFHEKEFYLLKYDAVHLKVRLVDWYLKKLGYLLSAEQRKRLKEEDSVVFGHKWAVEIGKELIYIAPYHTVAMPKEFKERCRIIKIPSKIRAYLYEEKIDPTKLLV